MRGCQHSHGWTELANQRAAGVTPSRPINSFTPQNPTSSNLRNAPRVAQASQRPNRRSDSIKYLVRLRAMGGFMKYMILIATLLTSQMSLAVTCNELEAQFIGYVKSVQAGANGTCEAKLSFPGATSSYSHHTLCALDIEEVVASTVTVSCNVKVGDILSGYLIRTVGESKIRLSY